MRDEDAGRSIAGLVEWPKRHALLLALAVLTLITADAIIRMSLVVDGTRYFWLDDDQLVSMRYARNLANGLGPVWNAGERVEGYTSLGWMLVMTIVHLFAVPDAMTSLVVKIANWLLACWVIVLTDRLLHLFVPAPGWARPSVLVALALCFDLLFWSVNGFETTILTGLLLFLIVRVVDPARPGAPSAITCLLMGLLPVARSDAYHLLAGVLLVTMFQYRTAPWRLWRLGLAAVVPVLQVSFRLAYYGEWLPNTYFLKVAGMAGLLASGAHYLIAFATTYLVALALAAAGVWWSKDRRRYGLAAAGLVTVVHVLMVGEDMLDHFRFVAPWVPVVLALAGATCAEIGQGAARVGVLLAALLFASTAVDAGVHGRSGLRHLVSVNGEPEHGMIIGLLIRDSTRTDASVAVVAAGAVPYFSQRRAMDMLGKTDARIARLPPRPGLFVGHAKFDIDLSLAARPDLVVPMWREAPTGELAGAVPERRPAPMTDYARAILANRRFQDEYRDQSVPVPYLLDHGAVYVRRDSPERSRIDAWRAPVLTR